MSRALENLVNAFMIEGMGPNWRECEQEYGEHHEGCSPCPLIKYGFCCHLPEDLGWRHLQGMV